MLKHAPTQVARGSFVHGRRYLRQVGRDVMLKAALANIPQEFLQLWNADHSGTAERIQRVISEFAFADVAADRPGAIVC